MKLNVTKEVALMEAMTVGQLQTHYVEVFGEPVRSRHKHYLIRRIAWRLQANAEGGLSERALARAEQPSKVHERSAEAIYLVYNDSVDPSGFDVRYQLLQGWPFDVATSESAIVITIGKELPAFGLLADRCDFAKPL